MTFNKRILIKPAIILLAALLALGYSLRKERTDDPVPEIAEMKRLLRDAAPGDASLMKHYTSADSALFRRKLYAEARRLNGVMRKADALLTRCLARPEFPENLKQITRMKLNIIREKKKETVK